MLGREGPRERWAAHASPLSGSARLQRPPGLDNRGLTPSSSSRTEEQAAQQPPRSQVPVANGAGGSRGLPAGGGAGWRSCPGAHVLVRVPSIGTGFASHCESVSRCSGGKSSNQNVVALQPFPPGSRVLITRAPWPPVWLAVPHGGRGGDHGGHVPPAPGVGTQTRSCPFLPATAHVCCARRTSHFLTHPAERGVGGHGVSLWLSRGLRGGPWPLELGPGTLDPEPAPTGWPFTRSPARPGGAQSYWEG